MSTNIVAINKSIPQALANQDLSDLTGDLTGGAEGGFAVLSLRGSRFRVKQGGEETVITNDAGDPVGSLEVVMVRAYNKLSKIYYAKRYTEGDDANPDCFSADGEAPDPQAEKPQAKTCAACQWGKWGSRVTEDGKKTKACSDSRRVAVMPAHDLSVEPMLLRVPAASLAPLAEFGKKLASRGIPYNAIVVKLGFDTTVSFPKLVFNVVRMLDASEAKLVADVKDSDVVTRILNSGGHEAPPAATAAGEPEPAAPPAPSEDDILDGIAQEMASQTENPAPPKTKAAEPAKAKTNGKAAPAKAAAKPEPVEAEDVQTSATADADLDALLDSI